MNEISLTKTNHTISQNRVSVTSSLGETVWTLPKRATRVSVQSASNGRKRLVIGGFKSVTVTVVGPVESIDQLWKEMM